MQNPRKGAPPNSPVSRQPTSQRAQPSRWSTKMLDCCMDMPVCLCGCCCGPILACQLAKKYGECCCQPMLPGGLGMLRASMRQRYNIEGNLLDDTMVAYFFGPCTLCQMAREYKLQSRKM
ncbi:cornifelin-like isoform X2 [Clupea harengus]|uniref:Cornifelin-like isoform X2 n=1 Tax=Clupea harengus TaxID=7950 RepID=A0A8M1KMS4_CLUHA|nr:cornifelin-like isoform X2 [Clupea harengus]